jgi:hypothetical protein
MKRSDDQCSEQEAQQRFEMLVKTAPIMKPTPLRVVGPKGILAQRKNRKSKVI